MISKKDVLYIASLSRIHLDDNDVDKLAVDLEHILAYIEKLKKLDIRGVQPTSHVIPLKNVFREDAVKPSLPHQEVMGMAVAQMNNAFKVPPVIEQ